MKDIDRRRYKRYKTAVLASIYTQDETISGTLANISKGGFNMVSEKVIHPDTKVVIELKFLGEYAFKGVVKWCDQETEEQKTVHYIGVEVEDIIWTNLKVARLIKWSEFVENVVSEIAN